MANDELSSIADLLKRANKVCASYLPLGGSLVAYELLLNLYLHHQNGREVTIKSLFAGIPYSDMGIRYHLRKLISDGWLELKPSLTDKRTRICVPTPLFESAWAAIIAELEQATSNGFIGKANGKDLTGRSDHIRT